MAQLFDLLPIFRELPSPCWGIGISLGYRGFGTPTLRLLFDKYNPIRQFVALAELSSWPFHVREFYTILACTLHSNRIEQARRCLAIGILSHKHPIRCMSTIESCLTTATRRANSPSGCNEPFYSNVHNRWRQNPSDSFILE